MTERASNEGRGVDSPRSDENEKERIDRELQELRVGDSGRAGLVRVPAHHPLRSGLHFRSGEKKRLLFTSNRLAIAGLLLLAIAIAIALALFVITSFLFSPASGWIVALVAGAWFGWFWYGLPLMRKRT